MLNILYRGCQGAVVGLIVLCAGFAPIAPPKLTLIVAAFGAVACFLIAAVEEACRQRRAARLERQYSRYAVIASDRGLNN